MPKRRRPAMPEAAASPVLDALEEDDPQAVRPQDPARIAVAILLRQAVANAGVTVADVSRDGQVVVVSVSTASWVTIVRDGWKNVIRDGGPYLDEGRHRYSGDLTWAAWAPSGPNRRGYGEEASDMFAECVSDGRHCVGFAVDAAWLPPDLVAYADHRLTVAALSAGDVAAVARELCGADATETIPDGMAASLTPRLLRLANRPGQVADEFIRKARALAAKDEVKPAPVAYLADTIRDNPTLDRLHGMDEAVAWGKGIARDLAAFKDGTLSWADVDRGVLLSGPPGCGKTVFAQALAGTCGVPLVTGSYGRWHATGTAHQGDFMKALKKTFAEAREGAPCILFVDEVDSFPDRSTLTHSHSDYMVQVVNALLAEIDGNEGRVGVVLVGACNHPEKLDPALVRSGRLDRHIRILLPDRSALAAILREHLGADLAGEDLSDVAMAASGSSGADCERLVRGARRRARVEARTMIMADLLGEVRGDMEGPDEDWRVVAVHEAGHVVASCVLQPGSLEMVTLRGGSRSGGTTASNMSPSMFLRADDLRTNLVSLLAGRAAEEEVLGVPSSGAGGRTSSDLAIATHSLLNAFGAYGLDDRSGLVWRGMTDPGGVPKALAENPGLAERVRVHLDEAYAEARELIRPRVGAVEAVATALLKRRTLDGPEAEAIVIRHEPGPGALP